MQHNPSLSSVPLSGITTDDREPCRSSTPRTFSELLDINWSIKPYEIVLLAFAAVCIWLISSTPLPFSGKLAKVFVFKACQLAVLTYFIATLFVLVRFTYSVSKVGLKKALIKDHLVPVLLPYFSLDFLMLTIRRTLALLGTIYFFLHLKHVVLLINPANYDLLFWELDRKIHLGWQPNLEAMLYLGQKHDMALFLDWIYVKYFDYKLLVSLLFLLQPIGRKVSERYFLGYALLWSVGGLSYLAMPADGPVYSLLVNESAMLTPEPRNQHIFEFPLAVDIPKEYVDNYTEAKIWHAKVYQEILWEHRRRFLIEGRLPGHFYGISAMPSLHVAAVTFLALFLLEVGKLVGLLAIAFGALTFIGSVFLQWHYAIDGYVGFLLAICIYWVTKRWRI